MIHHVLLVGGDPRMERLKPLLEAQGRQVETLGLIPGDEAVTSVAKAEALLFPYPFSVKNNAVPTLTGLTLYPGDVLSDVLSDAGNGSVILYGAGLEAYLHQDAAQLKALRLKRYTQYEPFSRLNNELSAEAAVCHAMTLTDKALFHLSVLVTGYGGFGSAVAKRLRRLGAEVWVAARREEQRQQAVGDGMSAVSIEAIPRLAGCVDMVMNTVPAPIIGTEALSAFPKKVILVELASAPYGFDRKAAEERKLRCEWLPGLPARYAPQSAALILRDACTALMEEAVQP